MNRNQGLPERMAETLRKLEKKERLTDIEVGALRAYSRFGDADESKRAERRLTKHKRQQKEKNR